MTPEDTVEGADTLSYVTGAHSMKFGGGIKHVSTHTQSLPFGFGSFYFAGDPAVFTQPYAFYQELASSVAIATADPTSLSVLGFAQDDWTIGPRLTLNAGLRYDVEQHFESAPLRRADRRQQYSAAPRRRLGSDPCPYGCPWRDWSLHAAAAAGLSESRAA